MRLLGYRICLLRHSCGVSNFIQLMRYPTKQPESCPFYMRMWNAHCFNFLGLRLILGDFK